MTYAYKHGKDAPKSEAFSETLDIKEVCYIEKGSVLVIKGRRCQVVTIRKIEVGNGIVKVSGKCIPANPNY